MSLKTVVVLCWVLLIHPIAAASLYNIEFLAFEYPDAAEEHWPAMLDDVHEWDERAGQGYLRETGATAAGVRMLSRKKFTSVGRLLNKKGLPVVAHLRWQQRIANRENTKWYQIDEGPLQGLVHLERGRFLHFMADLVFQGDEQRYRVSLQRRMKSGDTHYLDHPKIGVILRADPAYVKAKPRPVQPVTEPTPAAPTQPTAPKDERPSALPDLS